MKTTNRSSKHLRKLVLVFSLITAISLASCSKSNNIPPDKDQPLISVGIGQAATIIDSVSIDGRMFTSSFPVSLKSSVTFYLDTVDQSGTIKIYLKPGVGELLYIYDAEGQVQSKVLSATDTLVTFSGLKLGYGNTEQNIGVFP